MTDCSEKLKEKDFQNWLKAALAVSIAKKGIEPYVSNIITEFHQNALEDILSSKEFKDEALCTACTNNSLLPTTNKAKHNKGQDTLPKCQKHVCDRLRTKIVISHAYQDPSWRNNRVEKWCHCPWEIAKCYMPPDGYKTASSGSDTDLNGILSVMMNHLEFTNDKDECQKARDVTNRMRHSPNLSMNEQELEDHLKVLITFLDCETYLENNPAAVAALSNIKKLKEAKLTISTDDITEVLKTYVKDEIEESTRRSLDDIDQERRRCLEKIIEEINNLHSTKSESLDKILTARKEALHDIDEAKASSIDELKRTKLSSIDEINQCRQTTRATSTEESYETLKHDLKEDLLIFNNKLYTTIPLSPLFEKKDTPLVGFYVQPTINCVQYPWNESHRSDIKTEINCLSDIFKTKRRNEIYVTSKAGLGKTVFCKRLAVAWCHAHGERTIETTFETEEDLEMMRDFDFTFILPLREARSSDCDVDKMIQHQIIRHLARSQRYKLDFLQDILTKERCLIILDGLDEWTHPKGKSCKTLNDIPHRKARQNCTILTTTRTWKFSLLSLSTNQIDNLVQITGLGEKAAEQLIDNAVSKFSSDNIPDSKRSIKDFHHKLQENSINKFKSVPLILIHLICLWHKHQTIGESYCEIFSNIIGLHLNRAQIRSKDTEYPDIKKRKVDIPKCIQINKYCGAFHEVLKSLGQLAFHTFFHQDRENSLVFDIETAKQYLGQHFEFCLSTGLLTQNKGVENDFFGNVPRVSFAHKTFQEFFAALHVCTMVDDPTEIRPVIEICSTVKDILSVSNFFIFLNGMCPDKARTLSFTFYRVISSSDTVTGYRSDMGSWNYFVGYNETIKRIQSLFVDCVNESIDNGHTPVEFQIEDIIIDSDFQTESYSKVLKPILETNGKDVKSVKIREVKTKVEFSDIVQLLRKNGRAALEKLDLKCEICDESLEFLLQESVQSLKCFIMKGGQWLGNIWSHSHVRLSNKSIQIIWGMKQLEELYLRNIEMTHGQFDHLLGFVSGSTNMRHIGLGFIKCQKHDDYCSDTKLDLSNHSQLRMIEIGSIPISEVQINTRSLEVCYVGSFAKSVVLSKVLTFLSTAPKLHVFCCGFLTSQTDIEKMLETITHLHNLQHIWLVNMDLGCKTFRLSPKLESIENVFMIRIQMSIKALKKLVEEVQQIKRTVRVGLFDCMVEHHEDYEREIRSLKLSNTVHVIQDETKSQKDFIFKTLG
ncbi:uncharacterized protein LOC123543648 [Mercenaria mercenaria]|uniref:uncharacterized protein LOC123543648 n=1 Tax=Mercenaria mercenaria TaxID=6596 RepID=UPI00234E7461|nr:uncharacterized protein LOC123543648 [Mercenaria mercenaria]